MCRDLKNIAVFVSGGGTNLQAIIDACEAGEINGEIKFVLSNRKNAYGLERAKKHNIEPIYIQGNNKTQGEFDREVIKLLEEYDIDLIVLAGFLMIIGEELVGKYKNRIINIHPSLIPSFCGDGYYGLIVHEKALEYGVKVSGATTHFVDEEADTGPIILQEAVEVKDGDSPEDLQKRILEVEHRILVESVKLFCEDKLNINGRIVSRGE